MQEFGKKSVIGAAIASAVLVLGAVGGCGKSESSTALVAEAKQFQAKGDTKAAVIQLKNAVLKNPEDAQARLLLGTLYNDMADPASAEKELRKAQSLGAPAADVVPPLAVALLAELQFQKVIDETEALAGAKDYRILTARGDAFLALGKPELAKAAFDAALASKPDHIGAMIGQARLALQRNDLAGANAIADEAVSKNPKSADAFLFKGDLLRAQGKGDDALMAYDKVLALDPNHRSAHIEKANVEIAAGKYDAAKLDIDAARKATPNSLVIQYTQGLLDFSQAKYPQALESLQKVLRVAPEHMPTILMSGATEVALGSYAQAEQHLKKYLEKDPNNRYARKMMATTLLKLHRPADAQVALAPALKDDGAKDPQLLALAGEIALEQRDFAKSTDYFTQASVLQPTAAGLHTGLAMSKLGQGDNERAVVELERASKLDGANVKNGVLLVLTELRMKQNDKALAAATALETAQPKDPMVANLKGGVYMAKGDTVNARASFDKALVLQPDYFPAVANLAQMALNERKPDVAKKLYLDVIAKNKKQPDALAALALLAQQQGQRAEVTKWLEQAATENPDAVAPSLALGRHYLAIGEKQKALTLVRKLAVANAANTDVLDLLGQSQIANGDADGALDTYSKLAGQAPKSGMAQMRLATAHMALKNENAASADLKKALQLEPGLLDAQLAQAQLAMRGHKPEVALAIARDVQKQQPTQPIGYALEGDVQMALDKPALAVPAYEKAVAVAKAPGLMIKLAVAMKNSGKDKEAMARMQQWQKDYPADPQLALFVVEQQIATQQYKPAQERLEALLKQLPDNPIALNNLAWVYQQLGDARALPTAEQAYKVAGESAAVMDTLGTLLVQAGGPNAARGLTLLQKASTQAPHAQDIRLHLASALMKSGDKAGARREADAVLASGKEGAAQADAARALIKQL